MNDNPITQLILAFENYISQTGFGLETLRSAQSRGWLDPEGRPTDEGRRLCAALVSQVETRTAFRNIA
ncbi:MAG: hypothetical protein U1E62_25130 [Alsobacter sp.]